MVTSLSLLPHLIASSLSNKRHILTSTPLPLMLHPSTADHSSIQSEPGFLKGLVSAQLCSEVGHGLALYGEGGPQRTRWGIQLFEILGHVREHSIWKVNDLQESMQMLSDCMQWFASPVHCNELDIC